MLRNTVDDSFSFVQFLLVFSTIFSVILLGVLPILVPGSEFILLLLILKLSFSLVMTGCGL